MRFCNDFQRRHLFRSDMHLTTIMALGMTWQPFWHGSATGLHDGMAWERHWLPLWHGSATGFLLNITIMTLECSDNYLNLFRMAYPWPPLWPGSATGHHSCKEFNTNWIISKWWKMACPLPPLWHGGLVQLWYGDGARIAKMIPSRVPSRIPSAFLQGFQKVILRTPPWDHMGSSKDSLKGSLQDSSRIH